MSERHEDKGTGRQGEGEMGQTGGEVPLHQENWTSAAIDGARISAHTAEILVSIDGRIPEEAKLPVIEAILQAQNWLHRARELFPEGEVTSVHVVGASLETPGGIILP